MLRLWQVGRRNKHKWLEKLNDKGFTLIEVVIVIVILGILAAGMSVTFMSATEAWRDVTYRKNLTHAAYMASERMVREMRNIARTAGNDANITSAAAQSITFTNISGSSVTFQWNGSGNNLTMGSNSLIDAAYINNFTLNYYDDTNTALTSFPLSATDMENVRRIGLILDTREGSENVILRSEVTIRSLMTY